MQETFCSDGPTFENRSVLSSFIVSPSLFPSLSLSLFVCCCASAGKREQNSFRVFVNAVENKRQNCMYLGTYSGTHHFVFRK